MNSERFEAVLEATYREIEWSIQETAKINSRNPYAPLAAGVVVGILLLSIPLIVLSAVI